MKQFILYLDESGGFYDAKRAGGKPRPVSLVGGYYCPDPGLDQTKAKKLLDGLYSRHRLGVTPSYHAMETLAFKKAAAPPLLRDLMRGVWAPTIGGHLAVARNRGRGSARTGHLTYLCLAAECIVSVLRALIRQHGVDVKLKVVVSQRNARAQRYAERIEEHVAVTAYRLALSDLERVPYQVHVADPVDNHCLMVADHICFGIRENVVAQGDSRFTTELEERLLDEVVVESGQSVTLRRNIHEEQYGDAALEAIATMSLPESLLAGDARRAFKRDIVPALRTLPPGRREHEFRRLFDSIDVRANLRWETARGSELLALLGRHVIEPMRDLLRGGEAWIDFRFHQLSSRVANHRGDAEAAREHLEAALALESDVLARWETLPLWVGLKLDQAVLLTDACDYDGAIAVLDGVDETLGSGIRKLAKRIQASTAVHADVLGTIYGTRLQAHLFAARRDPSRYERARSDSVAAIKAFLGVQDLERQYLYRCHLETDAGELDVALAWLGRALHVSDAEDHPTDVAGVVMAVAEALTSGRVKPFHLRHFCRLWAAATTMAPAGALAVAMTAAWNSRLAGVAQPPEGYGYVHPWEVIDWKAGVALVRAGDEAGGGKHLRRSTERCLPNDPGRPLRPPIHAIGLGCLAEWAALQHDRPKYAECRNRLRDKTRHLLDDTTKHFPPSMRTYFEPWREVVEGNPTSAALLRLARDVAY